ncbi:hypothetical protein VIGAN_04201600 [Vigna angularis var. angularis]|uniref:Uncharacterized protein n=1 Tax=Vigna angularis var. angularis TaxID=157739 RepID=A0A0S3RVI0_PHAAN|nr:hypothetical protein VIGAN_04201600 [Vigna angularis var. angularis]
MKFLWTSAREYKEKFISKFMAIRNPSLVHGRCVDLLHPPDHRGVSIRELCERVVHHHHRVEQRRGLVRGGCRRDPHYGLVAAANNVVEEEVEVAELLRLVEA